MRRMMSVLAAVSLLVMGAVPVVVGQSGEPAIDAGVQRVEVPPPA